ncbi:MAG: hypothetical protein N2C14_27635, partial [Planctomycetales bacterium]
MNRIPAFVVLLLFASILLGCAPSSSSDSGNKSESTIELDDAEAVAALEAVATELKRDGEGFVIEVNFRGAEVADEHLTHLTGLRRVRSVLLNDAPVTDAGLIELGKIPTLQNADLRG